LYVTECNVSIELGKIFVIAATEIHEFGGNEIKLNIGQNGKVAAPV
jgi:hypothetical protein